MLCFSTPHFQTRCGLAVLNLRKGYGPPFAKNRTSFTTSDASDAENRRPAALPYAGCAPYSTGTEKQLSPSRSPQNRPRPRFAPRRPVLAGFHPRRGNDPPSPGQGQFGPHRAQFGRKERKQSTPESSRQRRRRMRQLLTFHQASGFSKNQQVVRGVKNKQVKGPGSLEASRAGSLRPAEPVVEGFFLGVNFHVFRGRFWGLGVTDGVRKRKFPGGKQFLRVSPPGSTKG